MNTYDRDMGKVAVVHKGAYSATVTYEMNDEVLYDHDSWRSLVSNNKGHTPAEDAWWTRVTAGGKHAYEKGDLANEKAALADEKAAYAKQQGDYAKQMSSQASGAAAECVSATSAAQKVNASLSGTTLTVTDRNGQSKSTNLKGEKGDKGDGIDYNTMTDEEKAHIAEVVAEEVARQGGYVMSPVRESEATSGRTFLKSEVLAINGVIYRCTADTQNLPVTPVVQDSMIVVVEKDGQKAIVIADDKVNEGWEVFADASNGYRIAALEARVATLEEEIRNLRTN